MSERLGSCGWLVRTSSALALVAGAVVVGVTPAPVAAATITGVTVQANMADHLPTSGNCIRYSPSSSPSNSPSDWVTSTGEARTAHGWSGNCTNSLDIGTQSALGFVPTAATSFDTSTPFLIGRMTHYNNPITASDEHFTGKLNIKFGTTDLQFPWALWETPNNAVPPECTTSVVNGKCSDEVVFTTQIAPATWTMDGMTYKLVMLGFVPNATTSCPATPAGAVNNQFITAESANTNGCLYAQLTQVRSLVIRKAVTATNNVQPASVPSFGFTPTSSLAGSPWTGAFSLTPTTSTPAATAAREFLPSSEDLTVVESAPGTNWALTNIACVDGANAALTGVTYNVNSRTVTLNNVPDAATAAAAPITCTFTNTYTARATLTLVKTVDNGGVGTAIPSNWTLAASGNSNISGTSGSASVTSQSVVVGTYTLSETGPSGYVQNGTWSCRTAAGVPVTVTNSQVALSDGQNVTCTVNNRYARGQFSVTKLINPSTGFTGTSSTAFSGTYSCGAGPAVPFSVSTGSAFTSPLLPAGTTCTVTETQPTGNLADTSYIWGAPNYTPGTATVTIADSTTVPLTITNGITRRLGTLSIAKAVQARDAASVGGYAGGTSRVFSVAYECKIGATVVASGTRNVTTAGAVEVTGVPATSVCTVSDAPSVTAGDFVNSSYVWDGFTTAPASVTVPVNSGVGITLTNYYVRKFASLTLAKVVQGSGYTGTGTPFTVNYDCGAGFTSSVNLAAGGSQTVTVPANTSCTVTENAPAESLLAAAYDWGTPSYAGLTSGAVSVAPGGSATVTVTNPTVAVFGKIRVTKLVTGETAGLAGGTTFRMHVACGTALDTTVQVAVGTPYVSGNLPVGTSCTITEIVTDNGTPLPGAAGTSVGLVGESYGWGTPPVAANVTVSASGSIDPATLTNTIVRRYGSLTIDKLLQVPTGMPGDATTAITYSGTWSCTLAATTVNGGWTRVGGGAATLTGPSTAILLGSQCSVTETPVATAPSSTDGSYHWGAPDLTGPITISAASPIGNIDVTNKVVRYAGSLAITKAVVGPAAGFDNAGTFDFSVVCTTAGLETINTSVNVLTGATQPISDVPAGSQCTVTETARAATNPSYQWDDVTFTVTGATGTPSGSSVSFTMPADANASVQVLATNTISLHTADVVVNKVLTGATAGYTGGPDAIFPVTLTCNALPQGSKYVAAGSSVTFPAIPVGQTCTVAEGSFAGSLRDGSFVWGTATYSAPIVVTEGAANTLTVTNPITRAYGSVSLVKSVELNGITGIVDVASTAFHGGWSCTYVPDNVVVSGSWSILGTGAATLTGPFDHVLVGSTCTATESTPAAPSTDPSYQWLAPVPGFDAATNQLTMANELVRRTATITVAKTVSGETAGLPAGATFDFTATCSLTGFADIVRTATAVVAGSGAVTIVAGAPVGWSCQLSEDVPALADASYAWGTPVWSPSSTVAVTTAGATYARSVDNPISRVTGTLRITKALAGTPADAVTAAAVFTGTYSCTYGTVGYTGTWSAKIGEVAALTPTTGGAAIPVTASCSITENAPSDALLVDASWSWNAPVVAPATATITGARTPASFTVTNSAHRVFGSLSVSKAFEGVGGLRTDAQVGGSWSCTWDTTGTDSGRWVLPAAGGTAVLFAAADERVPLTAHCTVTEDTLLPTDLVDGSFAWNAPGYAPANGATTLVVGGNEVAITNSTHRVYGGFQIRKATAGLVDATISYAGTYTCTHTGDADATGNWSGLTLATPVNVDGILVGSSCSVTETWPPSAPPVSADRSWVWTNHSIGDPATVTPTARAAVTITNRSQRVLGSFVIAKAALAGAADGASTSATYGFDWSCVADDGSTYSGIVAGLLAGGAAGQITDGNGAPVDVPALSTCTVTERALPPVNDPPFAWRNPTFAVTGAGEAGGTPVPGGVRFVVPMQGAVVVTATNALDVAAQIDKTFLGSAQHLVAGNWDGSWDLAYRVTVTNPSAVQALQYSLTDDPQGIAGVSYHGGLVTSAQLATPVVWDGVTHPFVIVPAAATVLLPAGGTHEYTVVLNLTAPAGGVAAPEMCAIGGDGPQQLGNAATVSTEGRTATDGDCGSVPPSPALRIVKDVTAAPVQDAAGVWTVVYSVTVTNTDPTLATTATVDDVLTPGAGVTVTGATVTGPGASATWNGTTDTRVVTATVLAGGQSVVYGVTLKATSSTTITTTARNCTLEGDETGTGFLNTALASNGATTVTDDACAVIPVPTWTLKKSSDPVKGTTVQPGSSVTYTLTVTNTSQALVQGATVKDDLSDVLDNAVLSPLAAGLTFTGGTLTWSVPSVPPGGSVTVAYTVTVSAGAWGHVLRNVATPGSEGGSCPVADDCTTNHPIPAWSVTKTSNPPSGSIVDPGTEVTYTLTVTNTSVGVVTGAVVIDDLSKVLAHATIVGAVSSDAVLANTTLAWYVPTLQPGASARLTYTVRINSDAFDVSITNVVTPEAGSGGLCVNACSTTTWTIGAEVEPPAVIPATGADLLPTLQLAITSIVVGVLLLVGRRRLGRRAS
ncbi:MAG: DUF5979 domain-containing protein [Ilumatobacteraceae bacterium]